MNVYYLLQKIPQNSNVSKKLESEFRIRANELKIQEGKIRDQFTKLNRNKSIMKLTERKKLVKDITKQNNEFSIKVQKFEKDKLRRQIEERNKILDKIHNTIKKIAKKHSYDVVIDSKSTAYILSKKDITKEVLKNIK
ncbi:OmpH family outer membrane protein [Candidatus Pantoea edessiphila]|uniref:OmpH family outer membrane protein n=1 Tax=Candidatus Pantoea edessiphila TaxID=2044610 RepID=UPI00131A3A96|nr:OmpH family outer membrane protein [Candidatus Pantoea edessiphila]